MKILFMRFPLESRKDGGAERQVTSLMEGLLQRGHAVAFAGSCPALLELCKERGIPSTALNIGPPPVGKWTALSFAWRKRRMADKLKKLLDGFESLDAIVMLSLTEKLLLTEPAAGKNIRVFWLEHDPVGRWLAHNPWLPRLRGMSAHATIVTVSEMSRGLYIQMGFDPTHVIAIPNGIDLQRFSPSDPSLNTTAPETRATSLTSDNRAPLPPWGRGGSEGNNLQPTPMTIGTVSRLAPEKGLDLLIQSLRGLPDASLTIVGSGREERNLRRLIATLPHPERCAILPTVPDLGAFYRSLELFVLPSRTNDPFGLVAAEAMSLGIPVVVTDACGIASSLKNGEHAVIVKANDAGALRDGIQSLRDPEKRKQIAEKGKDFARAEFSVERMVEKYEMLLR